VLAARRVAPATLDTNENVTGNRQTFVSIVEQTLNVHRFRTFCYMIRLQSKMAIKWSSGQSSWLQIQRPGFDSRHYQKKSSGSGMGSTQPREYN
jgi:hypothetical protein